VNKWNVEIQSGVYVMTSMAIELIALRLEQPGVPVLFLNTLTLAFNSETAFHNKNMHRIWDKAMFIEKNGSLDQCFSRDLDTHGWLLNFINLFGIYNGFEAIRKQLENSKDISEFSYLLKPLAMCSSYLNSVVMSVMYEASLMRIFEYIEKLEGEDFKDKNVGKVFDLLVMMKKISANVWEFDIENLHRLHLRVVLSMLKYAHFNSKMNSLKEVDQIF
jgi:hypothetical protein